MKRVAVYLYNRAISLCACCRTATFHCGYLAKMAMMMKDVNALAYDFCLLYCLFQVCCTIIQSQLPLCVRETRALRHMCIPESEFNNQHFAELECNERMNSRAIVHAYFTTAAVMNSIWEVRKTRVLASSILIVLMGKSIHYHTYRQSNHLYVIRRKRLDHVR